MVNEEAMLIAQSWLHSKVLKVAINLNLHESLHNFVSRWNYMHEICSDAVQPLTIWNIFSAFQILRIHKIRDQKESPSIILNWLNYTKAEKGSRVVRRLLMLCSQLEMIPKSSKSTLQELS